MLVNPRTYKGLGGGGGLVDTHHSLDTALALIVPRWGYEFAYTSEG